MQAHPVMADLEADQPGRVSTADVQLEASASLSMQPDGGIFRGFAGCIKAELQWLPLQWTYLSRGQPPPHTPSPTASQPSYDTSSSVQQECRNAMLRSCSTGLFMCQRSAPCDGTHTFPSCFPCPPECTRQQHRHHRRVRFTPPPYAMTERCRLQRSASCPTHRSPSAARARCMHCTLHSARARR